MIRHGLFHPQALGAAPSATDPRAPIVRIAADSFATSLVRDRLARAEAQRSGLFASIPTLPSASGTVTEIGRSSKSP